jgi:hypothetical protein
MTLSGLLVSVSSLLFVALALSAHVRTPSRSALVSAWVAMAGFAALALLSFWRSHELRSSWGPVYYDLPVEPSGPHHVALRKLGVSTGLRGRLVRKDDLTKPAPFTPEQDQACRWNVAWTPQTDREVSFNLEDVASFPHLLDYQVTEQTKPLLSSVALEVRCSLKFRETITVGTQTLRTFMVGFLVGLIVAAMGASAQRRRMRAQAPPAPVS